MPRPRKPDPEKRCEHCGKRLKRGLYNGRLEDRGAFLRRKYCSLSCANSKRENEHAKVTCHFKARKHIKTYCEACGNMKGLHAHHIDTDFRNNDPANIQTLCKHCHQFWHKTHERLGRLITTPMPSLYHFSNVVFPIESTDCALWATPSSRKSSPPSATPSSKRKGDGQVIIHAPAEAARD